MSRLSTSQHLIQQHLPISTGTITQPQLPDWVMSLPGVRRVVDRLGVAEFRRRLLHMTPALIPVGLPFIPHPDVWGSLLVSVMCLLGVLSFALSMTVAPLVMRKSETTWLHAVLGYMAPIIVGLILFPGRSELGLMTLQILAIGDGSATLGGMMLGGRKLPWNPRKTISGLLCFTIMGSLAATYSFWGEARPAVSVLTAFSICGIAALCAGIVESLPINSNDNFRVGTTALLVGIAMSSLLM